MTAAIPLPQEVIDNVLDYFQDDPSALKVCALVCHAWLSVCSSHLFRTISLQPPRVTPRFAFVGKPSRCQQIHQIIRSSPRLVPYIRNVIICEGMVGREWIAKEKTLPLFLRALSNVKRFHLERSSSMRIAWSDLPEGLRGAVQSVLVQPSLSELKLDGLFLDRPLDLLHMLQKTQHLRVLQADHLCFLDEGNLDQDLSHATMRRYAPLDVLAVGPRTSTSFINCILHPRTTIDLRAIRVLNLSISGNFPDHARLLRSVSSVETMELTLMNDIDLQEYWVLPYSDRLDLSHNPHLHTLDIKIDVIQRQDDPLLWLHALFSTVKSPNSLQYINIVYTLYLPSPYMDRSINTTIFTGWKEIDATLTSLEFPSLRKVKLEFSLENPIGFGVAPRFLKEVDLQSPALEAGEMLEVHAFDTSG